MAEHPNKHIREAIKYALTKGWRLVKAGPRAHVWYGFSVVLTAPALSAEECEALYEAGCDDGTIVTRKEVTFIVFDRKADSLEQAIRSATANVRAAGLEVERVEMPALV